jgi:hypothetical protein
MIYFAENAELFERLIPAELKTSSINLIKRNSISAQAYERLIRHMKHWFTTDPNNKFDPADIKSKEKVELNFSNWMDKTLSTRRSYLKRQQKKIDNEFDDDVDDETDQSEYECEDN